MKSDMTIAKGIILGFLIAACMAFTYTLDYAVPVGTQAPSVLDDYARNDKSAFIERLNVDHFFSLTGTQVSDAATGQHRQIEFYGPITKPTAATNKSWLYAKDVSDKVELHWEDEDGDEVQLTSGGVFNIGLLTSTTITTPTLTSPVFNTGVSGTAVLDEDAMASDSATQIATQQSIKAYIDDQIALTGMLGTWSSAANNTSYLAATDGFVCAWSNTGNGTVKGFTNSSNPPTTQRTGNFGDAGAYNHGITMPVKKGDYWKVTEASTVYWLPLGS